MAIPQTPFALCISCEDVFPGIVDTLDGLRTLLGQMDRTQVLLWCGRVSEKLCDQFVAPDLAKKDPFERFALRQRLLIRHFFRSEQIARINSFFLAEAPKNPVPILPTVFFRGQVLELIRWASVFCPDIPNQHFDTPGESRTPLAKALLIAGGLWNRRVYQQAKLDSEKADYGPQRFLVTFRNSREQDTSAIDLARALSRGLKIFRDHFPNRYSDQTKRDFREDFLSATGLSIEEYYDCWSLAMLPVINAATKEYSNLFVGPEFRLEQLCEGASPQLCNAFSRFMALKSLTPDELRAEILQGKAPEKMEVLAPFQLLPLVRQPIVRLDSQSATILDVDCFAQSALLGPLFHILGSGGVLNSIFGSFGDAFHEYCASIFRRIFPSSPVLASRAHCPFLDKNGQEIADACLDYGDTVVLVETKSVFIDKSAAAGDSDEYIDALAGKYVTGEERKQGVAQLATAVASLISGTRVPADTSWDSVRVIIPLMLVRDPLMEAPLHARYLADEFAKALAPDEVLPTGNMKKGALSVIPLILLTVETLEDFESSGLNLRELLIDYSADCQDRVQSLRNYLVISQYQGRIRYSETLREEAAQQLERLRSYFSSNPA